jgi:hypothetical protein
MNIVERKLCEIPSYYYVRTVIAFWIEIKIDSNQEASYGTNTNHGR